MLIALLSESVSVREAVLRQNRPVFDMPHAEFERFVATLRQLGMPFAGWTRPRMHESARACTFTRKCTKKLSKATGLVRDDLLPPDPDTLLQHFRFSKDNWNGPVSEQLSIAGNGS